MQVFDLENERALPTAIEAHLCEGGQDTGFARLRAKRREGVRPLLKTQRCRSTGAHISGAMSTSWRLRCILAVMSSGPSVSVIPQWCRKRSSTGRYGVVLP